MLDRRKFLSACTSAGVGSALLPGVLFTLAAQAQDAKPGESPKITVAMLDQAAALAGVPLEPKQKEMMLDSLNGLRSGYEEIRKLKMPNSIPPAFVFVPVAKTPAFDTANYSITTHVIKEPPLGMRGGLVDDSLRAPANVEDLAFMTVSELGPLLRARKITSVALTEMYIKRLKRYDASLHFVVTLTEERAMQQARHADEEIAAGRYWGPLHGIPWGAKDLLAVEGYPTTWGAGGFEKQSFNKNATVVERLDAAGAVLVAKMTLGALAMGDKWFGGRTRNPWNTKQGSSGSSAGSASAVAAGCLGFAIGSETLGSISSPSTRCGDSGLRPTFGFVPRTGAMALSWTMDKLGPICRSAEDCANVLSVIFGPDGEDLAVRNEIFDLDTTEDWKRLRIGYLKSAFDPIEAPKPHPAKDGETAEEKSHREKRDSQRQANYERNKYDQRYDLAALDKLRSMGVTLIPVELPKLPWGAMTPVLEAEAAAAFDDLTMTGRDKLLTEQSAEDWPNTFRIARFYPAVEYIQAMRARTLAIREMAKLFEQVDIIVTPSSGAQLPATNLTGHPALILPNGLRGDDAPHAPKTDDGEEDNIGGPGTPVSITFLAGLYRDAQLCAFGRAYQQATDFHKQHPKLQG